MWHIEQNLKRFSCQAANSLFKDGAQSYQVSHFTHLWNKICKRHPGISKYLTMNMTFGQWLRAHFHGKRYNIMTTGGAESINGALNEARSYPLIALLDAV